jgi:tetratricopeptide (TPR) repeat protein
VLGEQLEEQVVSKAEGNPYYLEEIIRSLIREGKLIQEGERGNWRLARDVDRLDLPDTLRGLLSARFDDLGAAERHVLQVASLIGNVFWRNVLQELVGTEVDLSACLTGLQRAQLVVERGQISDLGVEYGFRSALLREVVCDSLLMRQRTAYAERAADYMARLFGEEVLTRYYDVVAQLYSTAGRARRELFYTLSAAEHAQSIYANEEALALYRRALELIDQLAAEGREAGAEGWLAWRMEALTGMGRILLGTGRADQAEPYLRQAVEVAERSQVSAREHARLYYWLCEALFWLGRYEEQVETAQRGLALVAGEGPSAEVALMNQEIAVGSLQLGRPDTYREFTERTARFLESLPYSEELRPAYDHVASMYAWHHRDPEEAMRWLDALRARGKEHHDLRALAQSHDYAGLVLMMTGDLPGAIEEHREALELSERVGDVLQEIDAIGHLADALLASGALEDAGARAERLLGAASEVDNAESRAWACWRAGRVAHAAREWGEALDWFSEAAAAFQSVDAHSQRAMMLYHIATTKLHKGEQSVAVRTFEEAAALAGPQTLAENPLSLALVLTAIESASRDRSAFRDFCSAWRERIPATALSQWSLEPAEISVADWPSLAEGANDVGPGPDWVWVDPLDGSTCGANGDLKIEVPNGRGLWKSNTSAPRLLRRVDGDVAWQAVCMAGASDRPSIGGLVLWQSREDFIILTWGFGGSEGLVLRGHVSGEPLVIGRGWLPDAAERVYLRMEYRAGRVRGLCSLDGDQWYQVGETGCDAGPSLQIGLYAVGDLDRLVYPGAFVEGTAIVFRDVRVWGTAPAGQDSNGS